MATRRDRVLLQRLTRAINKSRDRIDAEEAAWAGELGDVFAEQVKARDAAISRALDALEIAPDGTIAATARNTEIVAGLERELDDVVAKVYGDGGSFKHSADGAGKKAQGEGLRRFGETLAAVDRPLRPQELKLSPATKKRYKQQLADMVFTFYGAESANVGKVRDLFLKHVNTPTATRAVLRTELERFGYGDAIRPMLDTLGRRITVSERADRIAKYEFARLAEASYQDGINDVYYGGNPPDVAKQFRMWMAVGDSRTQPSHMERNGKVYSLKKWNETVWSDGRSGLPPLRPRCRCDAVFVDPEWFSPESREKFFTDESDAPIVNAPEPVDAGSVRTAPLPIEAPQATQDILVVRDPNAPAAPGPWIGRPSTDYVPYRPTGKDSFEMYTLPGTTPKTPYPELRKAWTPERDAMHDEVMTRTRGHVPVQPQGKRTVTGTGGGPASGKTELIDGDLVQKGGILRADKVDLNADPMKEYVSEYGEMVARNDLMAAPFAHEESAYLVTRARKESVEAGQNILIDQVGGGDYEKFAGKLREYKAAGYRTEFHYMTIDTDEAVSRNRGRYERAKKKYDEAIAAGRSAAPPRLPQEPMVRAAHREVTANFLQAIEEGLFDYVDLWDNNGPKGSTFMVAKYENGRLTILDPGAWARFVAKKDEVIP